jgi:hypothetical protein
VWIHSLHGCTKLAKIVAPSRELKSLSSVKKPPNLFNSKGLRLTLSLPILLRMA